MEIFPLVIVLCLVCINAFYVAAEFATIGLRPTLVSREADHGSGLAKALLPFVADQQKLDAYIAACQIGITWSSLVLGAYGQVAFGTILSGPLQAWLGLSPLAALSVSAVTVLIVLTSFQMVFGELIPKSLALHTPLRISLWTVWPMRASLWIYTWPIKVLNGSGWFLLRLMGQQPESHRHIHSPEEISMLIAKSKDGGYLEVGEVKRLQGALRLGNISVRQVMTPRLRMRTLDTDLSSEALVHTAASSPFTRLPVHQGDSDRILGILFARDVAARALEGGPLPPLRELVRPAFFVVDSMPADRLLLFFRKHATHMAMVVDEFGAVVGLVTLDDVLSEILGEMPDEFKDASPEPIRLSDGRMRLPGNLGLVEAREFSGGIWPTEAESVAGAVLESLGRAPFPGDKVVLGDMEVQVESVDGNYVVSVLAKRVSEPMKAV